MEARVIELDKGFKGDQHARGPATQLSPFEVLGTTTGLVLLGITQPLFELLSRNGTFFVARNSPPLDIIVFALSVAFVLPAVLTAAVIAAGKVDRRLGKAAFVAIAGLLATLVVLRVIRLTVPALGGSVLLLLPAVVAGGSFAWSVNSSPTLRWILKLSPIVTMAVVVWFLAFSPLSQVVFVRDVAPAPAGSVERPADVVVLILDELPLATLLNRERQIDDNLFPSFARLAGSSTWYRNATTVSDNTVRAVPALLDGKYPVRGLLPTAAAHPRNVFTLLGSDYEVEAEELVTRMCPRRVCPPRVGSFRARIGSLFRDVSVITGHMLLPGDLSENLPPVNENWGDFAVADTPRQVAGLPETDSLLGAGDPRAEFRDFVARIRPLDEPAFYFKHVLLPHSPWRFLPGDHEYVSDAPVLGTVTVPGRVSRNWDDNPWLTAQGYQRHILQAMAVDELLGEFLDQLQATQMYEDSLVVVASDHGTSFLPGAPRRSTERRTIGEIAPVAMFIKEPGQTDGRVVDLPVQTIDILPTIASILDAQSIWDFDGVALNETSVGTNDRKLGLVGEKGTPYSDEGTELSSVVERKYEIFGGEPLDPYRLAPEGSESLIGRPAPENAPVARALGTVEDPDRYLDVDLDDGPLPALLRGRVESREPELGRPVVAVALNGSIAAVSEASEDSEGNLVFQVLLPPARFQDGRNVLELFLVEQRGRSELLLSLPQE